MGSELARKLKLYGTYPTKDGEKKYELTNVGGGFSVMLGAESFLVFLVLVVVP